jgi:hypothetical protein
MAIDEPLGYTRDRPRTTGVIGGSPRGRKEPASNVYCSLQQQVHWVPNSAATVSKLERFFLKGKVVAGRDHGGDGCPNVEIKRRLLISNIVAVAKKEIPMMSRKKSKTHGAQDPGSHRLACRSPRFAKTSLRPFPTTLSRTPLSPRFTIGVKIGRASIYSERKQIRHKSSSLSFAVVLSRRKAPDLPRDKRS